MKPKPRALQIWLACALALAIASTSSLAAAFSDVDWLSMGGIPGTDTPESDNGVLATAVDSSGNLYIGGNFNVAGGVIANHIAKWDGNRWTALGSGLNGVVYALAVSGSNVYAGGSFTTAGGTTAIGIAKWDGSTWSALGSGVAGGYMGLPRVYALAVAGSDVYAGGPFMGAGGIPASSIAKWDGTSWTALGAGLNSQVRALAVSGSVVYAAGDFTTAGGSAANYIAKWDGSNWSALGSGLGGGTYATPTAGYALAMSGNNLYVAGNFATAGGNAAVNIALWDGSNWSWLGAGLAGGPNAFPEVAALAVSGSTLYAGGYFYASGGTPLYLVAKWDGGNWTALGSGMGGGAPSTFANVTALAVAGTNVYAGGAFTRAGGSVANSVAQWDGSAWAALGSGLSYSPLGTWPNVSVLALSESSLYAGGDFVTTGAGANYIGKWNGSNWTALGQGMNERVSALAVSGSNVYAGGFFTAATNSDGVAVTAKSIAKWNGSGWSALGAGMSGTYGTPSVSALMVVGTNVYAGGNFTAAGSVMAHSIANWNGNYWTNLAGGFNQTVSALVMLDTNLYAGGVFSQAANTDGIPFTVNCIAKWNGSRWSALGSGLNGNVYALALSGTNLYAAGAFTSAGGSAANYVAKWDGNIWSALGSGVAGGYPYSSTAVYALAVSGTNLYAAGNFTTAGGTPANYIAKWDGTSWSPLGSGMASASDPYSVHPVVYALAASGHDLYAGGGFLLAGGKVSAYVAHALLDLPCLSVFASGEKVTLSWPSSFAAGWALEQADTLAPASSWVPITANVTDDGTNNSVTLPAIDPAGFFRLGRP